MKDKSVVYPHCGSGSIVRNGSANGMQRYKYRGCSRTYNALTGTPPARLRQKAKWLARAKFLRDGVTANSCLFHCLPCREYAS
ncbi:transposase [Nitrosomonas mobilis]|uniref:transposase n=1 Tax=Nitrosomonas mobilis TaxID=51642 RepID=UPI003CCC0A20